MGRSAGNDSGRSVFGGPPSSGGSRSSCGSWPEVELPSSRWGLGGTGGCGSADGLERLGPQRLEGVKAAPGERRSSGGRLTHGCVGPGRQSCMPTSGRSSLVLSSGSGDLCTSSGSEASPARTRSVWTSWRKIRQGDRLTLPRACAASLASGHRRRLNRKASLPKVRCSTSKCGCGVPAAAAVLSVQVRSHVGGQPIRRKCGLRTQR
jgi:hypothetical protein